jgi:hypothetical protein
MAKASGGLGDEWIDEAWLKFRRSAFWRFNRIMLLYFLGSMFIPVDAVHSVVFLIWWGGNIVILLRLVSRLFKRLGLTSSPTETGVAEVPGATSTGPTQVLDGSNAKRETGWWVAVERVSLVLGILSTVASFGHWLFEQFYLMQHY